MSLLQLVAVGFVLLAGTVGLAISLSRRMVPGSRVSLRPGALLLAVGGSFLGVVALLYPWRSEGPFVEWGLLCTGPGLLFSLVPAVAFWLILRRGAILEPASLGALAGFLAGLVGATGLHLQCWVVEAPHAAVWHLAVPVICAVLGYVLGKVIR
jgi:hypothetical protein